eukprot:157995_1
MCGVVFANFVIMPFYYLSRIFNMLFPFMILINLYINGYNLFDTNHIDLFQCIMLLLYLLFICILLILAIIVYIEHFYLWHLMPGKELIVSTVYLTGLLDNSKKKYNQLISIPVRNELLKVKYGIDIAKIIIMYCDAIDEEVGGDYAHATDRLLE